jgi:prepilin-type processing-associated H-X9-DG protein
MVGRRGFSQVELLVVIGIVGLLMVLVVAGVQKARSAADRATCQNNLKQIGLACHLYHDAQDAFPHVRLCPAPWQNGNDLYGNLDPTRQAFTGPNEIWWIPFDNRPGTTLTYALPDYVPAGLIFPFAEKNTNIFRCPLGIDLNPGGYDTFGQRYQVSYALNAVSGGPEAARLQDVTNGNGTGQVVLAWEHENGPQCWDGDPLNRTYVPPDAADAPLHYPSKHGTGCLFLWCDGHVGSLTLQELQGSMFYLNHN